MKGKVFASMIVFAVVLYVCSTAWSGQKTATFQVSAQMPQVITVSTTNLTFGQIQLGGTTNGTSTITVTAPSNTNYMIAINGGSNPVSATTGSCSRQMNDGKGNFIRYIITYSKYGSIGGKEWGDSCLSSYGGTPTFGCGATTPAADGEIGDCVGAQGTGSNQQFTVYGQIPQYTAVGANKPAGTYTDTLQVTVVF